MPAISLDRRLAVGQRGRADDPADKRAILWLGTSRVTPAMALLPGKLRLAGPHPARVETGLLEILTHDPSHIRLFRLEPCLHAALALHGQRRDRDAPPIPQRLSEHAETLLPSLRSSLESGSDPIKDLERGLRIALPVQQPRLTEGGNRRPLLEECPGGPVVGKLLEAGHVAIAQSLERHGHGFPHPPAWIRGTRPQKPGGLFVSADQKSSQTENPAEGEELAGPAPRRGPGKKRGIAPDERGGRLLGKGRGELEVAPRTGEARLGKKVALPVRKPLQRFPIHVDFSHSGAAVSKASQTDRCDADWNGVVFGKFLRGHLQVGDRLAVD